MTLKTYSMVPLYICFTLLWIPFSQLSIHNTLTCVYTYVQFPQFCIFRAGLGLWPFACWDCWFESSRGHGCLSVVRVVYI